MNRLIVLDSEAVQALFDPAHPKHRRAMSHVQLTKLRKQRAAHTSITVPTAVRVEAGWDRTSAVRAFINRLNIGDAHLDADQANLASRIRQDSKISVADAHIGAVVQSSPALEIVVLTSDPDDIRRAAGDKRIALVTL
jgi:predicted nucleic acid-binding protein